MNLNKIYLFSIVFTATAPLCFLRILEKKSTNRMKNIGGK